MCLLFGGIGIIWISTVPLPNLDSFAERKVAQSTKIYDRTGKVLLYDVHQTIRRTVVPFSDISRHIKNATVAIEDDTFYQHWGIRPLSFLRAAIVNLLSADFKQGGSTITQQVVKNSLLSSEKTISRKIREFVLAFRLEQVISKDEILSIYLNEVPYGGPIYGVEEASKNYFGKSSKDVSLAEAAYLAALPQAPTYFSPYGNHLDKLEERKNLVLSQMYKNKFITKEEYEEAKIEKVEFKKSESFGIKAPHFVLFVKEYLENEYGKEVVETGGLKVTTTLDYELQEKGEEIAKKYALANEKTFNAENAALIALDPTTGQILTMVGSRDYFDENIDGNFNIATASRQPGSAFKPIAYAEAFNKGYLPETIVFDLETEFSSVCTDEEGTCYNPSNYDDKFVGPISLRNALAQSRNIPAVKVLYLAGLRDVMQLARNMGLSTIINPDQYGLSLVLGGGEVKPLELANAYSVFASRGVFRPHTSVLKVEDRNGKVLEEFKQEERQILPEQTADMINDILSDPVARAPLYGSSPQTNFGEKRVAFKTGTTNDYRDAWIIGYTPNLTVAAWAGNNDNSPMEKKIAGLIITPLWREYLDIAMAKIPSNDFVQPKTSSSTTPMINGEWNIDGEIHSILHWINKSDPQYRLWEEPVTQWKISQGFGLIERKSR